MANTNFNRDSDPGMIHHFCKSFSWSAIIAGALVGIGVSFLLNVFGLGLGLTAFATSATSAQTLAIGGFIALILVAIVSMSALGWVAGYLGAAKRHCPHTGERCNYGCLYGFVAWCLALVLTVMLSGHMAKFVGFTMYSVNPTLASTHQSMMYKNIDKRNVAPVNMNQPNTAVNTQTTTDETTTTTRDNVAQVDKDTSAKALATTAFITFILFFIGALSATIAGHWAYRRFLDKELRE